MGNRFFFSVFLFVKKNYLLTAFVVASVGLSLILRQPLRRLPTFVDWNTIITLSGLLLITMGIKESGLFYLIAYRISRRIDNERFLALFLIFISLILSVFLTNDITLFIIVPLTLSLQEISDNDYSKTVVFEAIAVNVGSSLTAIGNPQNIFLWHQWGISFLSFIKEMTPLVLIMSAWLFIFAFFAFPSKRIKLNHAQHPPVNRRLFFLSAFLLILFIFSVELNFERYLLLVIILAFLFFDKKIISETDWGLILLFIFIFIDIQLLCQLKEIGHILTHLDFNNTRTLLLSGSLLSQVISNVPATILLSHYSSNFKIISYGVNIGGNGLLIGSFANLIALRFINNKSKYFVFHVYSISYFIITLFFILYFYFKIF